MTLKVIAGILAGLVLTLTTMLHDLNQLKPKPADLALGSVSFTNEYFSTTTSTVTGAPTIWNLTATSTDTQGGLGSVVMTAAGTAGGNINIYDATTTNVNARTSQRATSTLLLASVPTNAAANTYTFDVKYRWGLLVVTDGTVGTTTITWR